MLPRDRRIAEKYRKRMSMSVIIILILTFWLIRKYDDVSYLESDREMFEHELLDKDLEISKLENKIDSLSKPKEIVVEEKLPVKTRRIVQDTIKQLPKVEIIKEIESDTL